MTDDHDPDLVVHFTKAEEELSDGKFSADVIAQTGTRHRQARPVVIGLALLSAALGLVLLASSLQLVVLSVVDLVTQPLVAVDPSIGALLLAPVNMVAFPAGLVLLSFWLVFRNASS